MSTLDAKISAPGRDRDPLEAARRIGARLRDRRKLRQMSLQEVAQGAGISAALLSQVERGLSTPSIESMMAICDALDMPVSWLFDNAAPGEDSDAGIVVRRGERRILDLSSRGMTKEMLTPDSCRQVQMMRIVIRAGGTTGETPYNHSEGAKCGTVLAGVLGLEIDGQVLRMRPGDSFAFSATSLIRFWNDGPEEVEMIWVGSPAYY